MKNKAFTLVELLGVIIILGVLSLIIFPVILTQIKNAKKGIDDSTKELIIDAAKDYVVDNTNNYDKIQGITYCIDINALVEKNYLNPKLKNENLNDIDTTKKIKLTYNNNNYNYEITDICTDYTLTRSGIEVPILNSTNENEETSGLYLASLPDIDRFIYRGENPNNYIWLDENGDGISNTDENDVKTELYRIISFESDGTIKVIRNNWLPDKMRWDEIETATQRKNEENTFCNYSGTYYGCNVWGNLNNTYYNGELLGNTFNFKYYESPTEAKLLDRPKTGTVIIDSTLNTYLNSNWLNSIEFKNYIEEHKYNVGGIYYRTSYTEGNKGLKKEKSEEYAYTWNGYVGLMSLTEFVETSTNQECTSVYSDISYFYNSQNNGTTSTTISPEAGWPCSLKNWIYIGGEKEYTLTIASHSNYHIWTINEIGFIHSYAATNSYRERPVFYLKSSTILTGDGTETNPYKIQ